MRIYTLLASILLLAGCNPPQNGVGNETSVDADLTASEADGTADSAETKDSAAEPDTLDQENSSGSGFVLANTAWRATGEDGAIYTTFLDLNGDYRDQKNGEPWQSGSWERLPDGRLCFTPEEEGLAGACWTLGEESRGGKLRVKSDAGREVELQQVTYIAPLEREES